MGRRNEERRDAIEQPVDAGIATLAPKTETITREIRTAIIEAPIGEPSNGFRQSHVEVRFYVSDVGQRAQSETLSRLANGLRDTRATLANGRDVKTTADAVRWLLEQLAETSDSD